MHSNCGTQTSKQSDSQGSEGSFTLSPSNSGMELSSSREVSFAADLSCVVNDADDNSNNVDDVTSGQRGRDSTECRHRTMSWSTAHLAARKYIDTYAQL